MQVILLSSNCKLQHVWTAWVGGRGMLGFTTCPGQSAPSSGCISIVDSVKLFSKTMSQCTIQQTIVQRYVIKFRAKLGKSYTDINQLIQQAYVDSALLFSQVWRWLKMFKEGQEEVTNKPRSGWSSTSHNEQNGTRVHDLLNSDRRMSVRMIAWTLNLQIATVHIIIKNNLNMRKVCTKLVPKVRTLIEVKCRIAIQGKLRIPMKFFRNICLLIV